MTATLLLAALASAAPGDATAGPAAPPAARTADLDEKARAWFTDAELVTHEGKPVRFYSDVLEGRVVVVGFVFTRCVGACPIIMSKLARVRDGLGDAFGRDVRFVLISVDSEFDTPQEMKRFAEKHRATEDGWTYLTGKKENVSLVLKRLGAYVEDPGEHGTGFIAGNVRSRHWTKIQPQVPPPAIVEQLRHLAGGGRAGTAATAER